MADDDTRDNIAQLPRVRPKQADVPLELVHSFTCRHGHFLVDEKAAEVECGLCHAKLNPIWVLGQLANDDSRLRHEWAYLKAEARLLRGRVRTKCDHCGNMTTIKSNVRTMDRDRLIQNILSGDDDEASHDNEP
jgi:ribosomal protein S27E